MTAASPHYSTLTWVLIVIAIVVVVAVLTGIVGRALMRRGMHTPLAVRLINHTSDQVISAIKRPITVAVLDEVADVLRAGHYTQNVASALQENRSQLKQMFAEKIKNDPTGKNIGLLPFHDKLIDELTETVLRVIFEVLADPRTDELVSDMLRDNITQIRAAVRERQD